VNHNSGSTPALQIHDNGHRGALKGRCHGGAALGNRTLAREAQGSGIVGKRGAMRIRMTPRLMAVCTTFAFLLIVL
jgi:hypothetical protein